MARICSSCGRANDDQAAFCAGCGSPLSAAPAAAAPAAADAPVAGAASVPVPTPPPPPPPEAAALPPQPSDVTAVQPGVAAVTAAAIPSGGPGGGPGGGPPRKGLPAAAIVAIILGALLVVAMIAAAGVVLLWPDGGGKDGPTPTPVVTATTSPTGVAGTAGYLVAGSGSRANRLAAIASDGTATVLASNLGNQLFQIVYSPDGATIACIGGGWQRSKVWLYGVASGAATPVDIATPNLVAIDSIAWLSSSELLIAGFTATPKNTGENAEFVVYDPADGTATPLADSGGVALRGVSVSASRDGSKIAYVTYTDQKTNQYGMPTATERLELLDRSNDAIAELGHDKALFDVNARRFDKPLISPDGTAVIYRRAGSDVGTEYTVVDAEGTTLMSSGEVNFPAGYAWDPTGSKVVYTSHSVSGNGGTNDPAIFSVFDKAGGGGPQVIARYKGTMVQDVAWSPDGSTIAWSEYDKDQYQTGVVYLTAADGGDARFLYKGALTPAWAPGATVSSTPTDSSSP